MEYEEWLAERERTKPEPEYKPMTEREALLRTIIENPRDDTAWKMYADFLEGSGKEGFANLLRITLELSETDKRTRRAKQLRKREKELVRETHEAYQDLSPESLSVVPSVFTDGSMDGIRRG